MSKRSTAKKQATPKRVPRPSPMEWATKAKDDGAVVILHLMEVGDDFDDTADRLFQMVKRAVREHPGRPRWLYLDIEGHRNSAGGFDTDSFELQKNFVLGFLGRWLTRICTPMVEVETRGQHEDLPDHVITLPGGKSAEREQTLRSDATAAGEPTYDSETGEWVEPDGTRKKH